MKETIHVTTPRMFHPRELFGWQADARCAIAKGRLAKEEDPGYGTTVFDTQLPSGALTS